MGDQETQGSESESPGNGNGSTQEQVLAEIQDALRGLKFGQVVITVQDGFVIQIERLERRRIQRRKP